MLYTDKPAKMGKGHAAAYEGPIIEATERVCECLNIRLERRIIDNKSLTDNVVGPTPFALINDSMVSKMHILKVLRWICTKSNTLKEPDQFSHEAALLFNAIIYRLHAAIVYQVIRCIIANMGRSNWR